MRTYPIDLMELFLATTVVVLGAWQSVKVLDRPTYFSMVKFCIFTSCIYFGVGPWVAYVYSTDGLPSETADILFYTYAVIAVFLLGLMTAQQLMKRSRLTMHEEGTMWIKAVVDEMGVGRPLVGFVITWLYRIWVALEFGIMFSGTATSERIQEVSYSTVVMGNLIRVAALGSLLWCAVRVWRGRGWLRGICGIMLLCELGWAMLQGRRWVLGWALIVLIGYAIEHGAAISLRRGVMACLVTVVLCVGISPFFLEMRDNYDYGAEGAVHNSVVAMRVTLEDGIVRSREHRANLSSRLLINRFIARILECQDGRGVMGGLAAWRSIVWGVPSAVYPQKLQLLETEQYIQSYYGQPLEDTSISWPAVGCADFGVLGGFAAGLLLGMILVWSEGFCVRFSERHPFAALGLFGALLETVVIVDSDPVQVWSLLRTFLIVAVMYRLVANLVRRRHIPGYGPNKPRVPVHRVES